MMKPMVAVLMAFLLSTSLACADPFAGADVHLSLTADGPGGDSGTIALAPADWTVDTKEEEFADFLSDAGAVMPGAVTAGLLLSDDPGTRRSGLVARDALLYTGLASEALKLTIHSSRPNDPDASDGFPSMHTSMNFALARSVAEGSDEWGMAAYAWAAGVAWSRVRLGEHTVPQVLAGAALGWFIADDVARDRR